MKRQDKKEPPRIVPFERKTIFAINVLFLIGVQISKNFGMEKQKSYIFSRYFKKVI
jgi:hypothetical protein